MSIVNKALDKMKEERSQDAARTFEGKSLREQRPASLAGGGGSEIGSHSPIAGPPPDRIVTIDRIALQSAGMVPGEADRVAAAEQYRSVKQDLIRYCAAESGSAPLLSQFIMVTSALPGDGKTFTSLNLALSMVSERDHDVLLVDGDLAMSNMTRSLGMAEEPGLLDVLREPERRFSSIMYSTDVQRLFVVPAGKWSEDASELLASERMTQLVSEIALRHPRRIVVFDSSPVLVSSDSRVLARSVGQIVFVVSAGTTLQNDVKQAVGLLKGGGRRLTLVMNQTHPEDLLSSLVGYRYGYGYGARGGRPPNPAVPPK